MMSEGLNTNGATSSNISSDVEEAPVLKALASHFERWPVASDNGALQQNTQIMLQTNVDHVPVGLDNPFWKSGGK